MPVLYNPQNVVVGMAVGYFAKANTAMPANTIEYAGDWGTGWVQAGATEEGWRLGGDTSTTSHNVEEQANPVAVTLDSQSINISAALAEDTLQSLRLAFGGGTITVTPGTSPAPTIHEFKLAANVEEFAVGLDLETYPVTIGTGATAVLKKVTRRIYIPRAAGSGSVDAAFRRAAAKRTWPITFAALCKPEEIIIRDIIPTA